MRVQFTLDANIYEYIYTLTTNRSLELPAIERQECLVIERVSGRPQNSTVQGIV